MAASEFVANPRNPRRHPERQRRAVKASLDALGWVAPVIVNARSGYLLDGHERVWQALRKGEDTLVPFVEVDLNEDEEAQFLATFDYITYLAQYDQQALKQLMQTVNVEHEDLKALLTELQLDAGLSPEREIASFSSQPVVYRPTQHEPPKIDQLFDASKFESLIANIESANLPADLASFLKLAATRHIKFNYEAIAEYYCHAPEDVKRLFEQSVLVIVDVGKALELGYANFIKKFLELFDDEAS